MTLFFHGFRQSPGEAFSWQRGLARRGVAGVPVQLNFLQTPGRDARVGKLGGVSGALAMALALAAFARAGDLAPLPELFAERVKAVVAVEFTVETELDRHPTTVFATVADAEGVIILPPSSINPQTPPKQLRDFKVYRPGSAESFAADYLGQDALTGWHFLRVEEKLRGQLLPITAFAGEPASPALGEELWGIGLRNKDEDFLPYLMTARLAMVQTLPQKTGVALAELAGPGLPVFDRRGALAGLAINSLGQSLLLFSQRDRGLPVLLVNVEESSGFLLASEVLPHLGRVPRDPTGRPLAWLGAYGLQPMEPEVAKFLKLEDRPGVVVSEVLEDSPAQKAGLKDRDIILALDGQMLPRLKPGRAVVGYFEREIARRAPGDLLALTVLRDGVRVEVKATLGDTPKLVREAARRYFDRLGFSVREFLYGDAVSRRLKVSEQTGVVANFVKPNSPANLAGLRGEDWIREIDGQEVSTHAAAVERLAAIEADKGRGEFVLLTSRDGETSVLRVKLK